MDTLYGRAALLSRSLLALERARIGQGKLLLFTGEPGIGKSRLAEQVAAEAATRGAAVAWGRCWEAGGAPAYWPWLQVFRTLEMDEDPFVGAASELAVSAPEARFSAFDRAVQSLRALARQKPITLVLDDLHAADEPSLLLLLLLARELARSSILLVGAYRDAELRLTPERAALLAKIAREAEVVPLSRLGPEDVATWMEEELADANRARAAELYRMSEGHPLIVVEALRLARAGEANAPWSHDPGAVLDERLARLSPEALAVIEVASVFGREFSRGTVAETAQNELDQVHRALSEAVAINIIAPTGGDRFRFSHVLLRDRVYAGLLPSLRAALHYRAGTTLLAQCDDAQAAVHHLFEGQAAGSVERVAEVALAACQAALSRLAFEEALRLGRRALNLPFDEALPVLLIGQLELVVAEALMRIGETHEGKALCVQAAARAEQSESTELLARAALVYGTELASGTVDPQMVSLLRKALASLDTRDSTLRSRLLTRLSAALTPTLRPEDRHEVLTLMRASLDMARRLGDRGTLLYALQFAATVGLLVPEQERFSMLEETLALARALDQPLVLLHTFPTYVTDLLARGERARAETVLPAYKEALGASQRPLHNVRYLLVTALRASLDGDFAEADRLASQARTLSHSDPSGVTIFLLLVHRLGQAQLRAEPALLNEDASSVLTVLGKLAGTAPHLAWFLAGISKRDEAIAMLSRADLTPETMAETNLWDLSGVAEAAVMLADVALGERLYPHAVRAADRMFWNMAPGAIVGPSSRVLGDLALMIGRARKAVQHYDDAIAFCSKMNAPWLVAHCKARRQIALARVESDRAPRQEQDSDAARTERAQASPSSLPPSPALELRREGDIWTLEAPGGVALRLKHGKGLAYLQYLLDQAGREIHVLELVGIDHRVGDAGPVLDARAKAEYRARLDALRDELSEAEQFGDRERASRAEQEIDAIAEQLAGAFGVGGRERRAASDVERTRINVQRRLKDAIERIATADASLGRYLSAAIKTGVYCVYKPL